MLLATVKRLGVVCLALSLAQSAAAQKTDAQVLKDFGAELMKNAPPAVRDGTPVEKARYGFAKYCDVLARNKVPVNSNLWTRLQNATRNFDASKWTCGDHAMNLEALFQGMGIKQQMPSITADSNSSLPTPNADHGALGVEYQGKVYFFDAWQLAVNNHGSYAGAASSKWNGMEAGAWEAEMKKQGYVRFSDDQTNWRAGIAEALAKYLKGADKTRPPKDVSKLTRAELEGYIESMKAQHRKLQEELVALPPGAEATATQIRVEQRALFQEVMRLKQELGKR